MTAVNIMLERIKARTFDGVKARVTYYHTEDSCHTMRQGKVALKAMAKQYGLGGGYMQINICYPCGCEEVYVNGVFTHCDYCKKCGTNA